MGEECRAAVSRLMSRMIKILLNNEEENETYVYFMKISQASLDSYSMPQQNLERVSNSLIEFLDRCKCENLPNMADTTKTLNRDIVDDNLKAALFDFLLSVIREALHSARDIKRRNVILNALAADESEESPIQNDLVSIRQPSNDQEATAQSVDPQQSIKKLVTEKTSKNMANVADSNEGQGMPQLNKRQDRTDQMFTRNTERDDQEQFLTKFGNYLHRKFHNVQHHLFQHGEEGFLMREIISMFFLPNDCYYFEVYNHTIQLRDKAITNNVRRQLVLDKFVKPLQNMQMMQLYIKCSEMPRDNGVRLKTLTTLTDALKRLIKPLVETLIQFERNLDNNKYQLTLVDFQRATDVGFKNLDMLWNLASVSYISYPTGFGHEPHSRSQHIYHSLADLATQDQNTKEKERRPYSAALLMYVLQVYCRFLDNWWQMGKFNDGDNEFPAMSIELNGCIEYVMRQYGNGKTYVKICPIYLIIKRHIESAGAALAILYNSKLLGNFVIKHKTLLEINLHHAMVQSVYDHIKFYEQQIEKRINPAPDIYWQMKLTEDEHLRCLYNVYYKETIVDFSEPELCHIDEMLKRCQNCAVYTPLTTIICQSLEHFLDQRALLLNKYVIHLLMDRIKLVRVLSQMRSTYLLLDFEIFADEYTLAVGYLECGRVHKAKHRLQLILDNYNRLAINKSCVFTVSVPDIKLKHFSLDYSCELMIASIVTKKQLEFYNEAFSMRLQLQVIMHRLKTLPQLPAGGQMELIQSLKELQLTLLKALEKHDCRSSLKKVASYFEDIITRCEKLTQLQMLHGEFVQILSSILCLNCNRSKEERQDLMIMSRLTISLWELVNYVLSQKSDSNEQCAFNQRYEANNVAYLSSIGNSVRILLGQQALKDTPT